MKCTLSDRMNSVSWSSTTNQSSSSDCEAARRKVQQLGGRRVHDGGGATRRPAIAACRAHPRPSGTHQQARRHAQV